MKFFSLPARSSQACTLLFLKTIPPLLTPIKVCQYLNQEEMIVHQKTDPKAFNFNPQGCKILKYLNDLQFVNFNNNTTKVFTKPLNVFSKDLQKHLINDCIEIFRFKSLKIFERSLYISLVCLYQFLRLYINLQIS